RGGFQWSLFLCSRRCGVPQCAGRRVCCGGLTRSRCSPMTDSMTAPESAAADERAPAHETVAAGVLAPWEVAELPAPPAAGWRLWVGLIGPGVVLAGTSIGTGEWLFGPGVSAQYGATLFWLALSSIICQGFANLMMMRYAIYCGEPVIVGILRM